MGELPKRAYYAGNATYCSRQIVGQVLQCISHQLEVDTLQQLASSTYFSMTNESTDISVLEQLILVVRYHLPTGDVTTSLLAIDDLPDGTADSIETGSAILKIADTKSVDLLKLRGFGSDGAPVMCSSRNGVPKRLINSFPKLISIHCVNYRLALAAAHTADDIPYLI